MTVRLTQASAPLMRSIAVRDEFGAEREVAIPAERALTVFVDKRELVTLMTLGAAPELLVLGYLRNQRLVESVAEIDSVTVDWEVEAAAVATRGGVQRFEEKTAKRVVTTGCGQGTVFGDLMADLDEIRLPPASDPRGRISQATLYGLLDAVRRQESTYKSAGSVHGCALFRQDELLMFVEDVGRHNAIDTIAGWMWLHGVDGADKIFYTTGRLTSEMVIKSAQMGVPIVVSRSGITQMGYELARQLGLALFGRATNRHSSATRDSSASRRSRSRPGPRRRSEAGSGDAGQVAQHRRAGAALDLGEQLLAPAEREQAFGHHEHRADQQAHQVVGEGGLAPFVVVADELDAPADAEEAQAPAQPGAEAVARDAVRGQHQHRGAGADGQAQQQLAARQVPQRHGGEGQPGRRQREPHQREGRAREQHADREHDHRHADEMARDVAPVAVAAGVGHEQIERGAEQAGHGTAEEEAGRTRLGGGVLGRIVAPT